jgi:hypothetical protein
MHSSGRRPEHCNAALKARRKPLPQKELITVELMVDMGNILRSLNPRVHGLYAVNFLDYTRDPAEGRVLCVNRGKNPDLRKTKCSECTQGGGAVSGAAYVCAPPGWTTRGGEAPRGGCAFRAAPKGPRPRERSQQLIRRSGCAMDALFSAGLLTLPSSLC